MRYSFIAITAILLMSCCSQPETKKDLGVPIENWNDIGITSIEFFDSNWGLHMPIKGVYICGESICSYSVIPKLGENEPSYIPDVESELKNSIIELNARMPEKGRILVGIGVNEKARNQDVIGATLPVLDSYALSPDTVEVVSLERDSATVRNNPKWRFLTDSVVFRHIVMVRVQRFVRK